MSLQELPFSCPFCGGECAELVNYICLDGCEKEFTYEDVR